MAVPDPGAQTEEVVTRDTKVIDLQGRTVLPGFCDSSFKKRVHGPVSNRVTLTSGVRPINCSAEVYMFAIIQVPFPAAGFYKRNPPRFVRGGFLFRKNDGYRKPYQYLSAPA